MHTNVYQLESNGSTRRHIRLEWAYGWVSHVADEIIIESWLKVFGEECISSSMNADIHFTKSIATTHVTRSHVHTRWGSSNTLLVHDMWAVTHIARARQIKVFDGEREEKKNHKSYSPKNSISLDNGLEPSSDCVTVLIKNQFDECREPRDEQKTTLGWHTASHPKLNSFVVISLDVDFEIHNIRPTVSGLSVCAVTATNALFA